MKRPFAVIGFSMLISSLFITMLNLKMTVAFIVGAMVIFCVFMLFKGLRKHKTVIFSLVAVAIYAASFISAQYGYYNAKEEMNNGKEITGIVCQTPTMSDYAFTYVIKCDGENYKIRYVAQNDKFLTEGDRVKISFAPTEENYNEEFFEYSLSSKIYFNVFESNEATIVNLQEKDEYYNYIGKIKNYFTTIVDNYLPCGAGGIAKAMTIGERYGLDDKTVEHFNYSGVSHLLVISGLHITMWSLGIIKLLERIIKSKKLLVAISLFTLLSYSAITGFGVSVIRAGFLIGLVILSKLFDRDADSLNSIGLATAIILITNPFSAMSASLWLTVLSTIGILVVSKLVKKFLENFCEKKHIRLSVFVNVVINSISISVSTAICTLPVFIVKLNLLPIGSIVANLLMVDAAMMLMVLTVAGVLLHSLNVVFFARPIFMLVGLLSEFLTIVAQKIGMADWSTISLSHRYFEYFLVVMICGIGVVLVAKQFNKNIIKHISVILSVVFVLIICYTTSYDYNNACVEILFTDEKPAIIVKAGDNNLLVGTPKNKYLSGLKQILNSHNEKTLDYVAVTDTDNGVVSRLLSVYDEFGVTQTYFCDKAIKTFDSHSTGMVDEITLAGKVRINLHNPEKGLEISTQNKKIIFVNCEDEENVFENFEMYDIIILYGKKDLIVFEEIKQANPKSEVFVSNVNEQITIYIEQ